MLLTIIIVIIIAVILIFLNFQEERFTEYKKAEFLSTSEKKFYIALDNALGKKYKIFIKPRLADLIKSTAQYRSKQWWSSFGKIQSKHVDFILCDTHINPVCVIELDDRSHNSDNGIKRDNLVNNALEAAGIPILHFAVRSDYSNIDIAGHIRKVLPDMQKTDIPKCPKCGKQMIKRTAKNGANAGHDFWGCSDYPSCKGIVNIET